MKLLTIPLILFLVVGCASNYEKKTFWSDGGFSETEIQPNVFNVRFMGNAQTSAGRAKDFAMLRASELCIGRGMQYMDIGSVTADTRQTGFIPGSSTTTANATAYGNSAFGSSTTTFNPGTALYSPESGLTVACLQEKKTGLWDAEFLAQSLKTKYEIVNASF